mmetsp:Transcript_40558/g.35987  ORF Transcript_40558/g.35987 Transcript_40558/m.35987 type:complete len:200 (-) Transcript_40558:31-630(-)
MKDYPRDKKASKLYANLEDPDPQKQAELGQLEQVIESDFTCLSLVTYGLILIYGVITIACVFYLVTTITSATILIVAGIYLTKVFNLLAITKGRVSSNVRMLKKSIALLGIIILLTALSTGYIFVRLVANPPPDCDVVGDVDDPCGGYTNLYYLFRIATVFCFMLFEVGGPGYVFITTKKLHRVMSKRDQLKGEFFNED